jgi:hypothetical protein
MTGVSKALVTVLAVLSCAGLPVAQSKPSFAGKWALPNLRDGVWSPFGSWFIAVQDEHTLSIEEHVLLLMDPDGPASVTTDSVSRNSIPLGGESRKTFDAPSPIEVNMRNSLLAAPFTAFGFPLSSVTRSGWEGDQLVVVTHTIEKYISAPGRTPREFESDRVHWMAISLDKDGRLVVEVLQFGDPGPWDVPSRSPSPSSQRITYTRMR